QVLRLAEERIRRRQHLVKGEARLEFTKAERHLRADDVHLMAALRQRLAELGRDDAAAADRGVTDDADVHAVQSRSRCGRSTGSRTTNPSAKSTPASTPNCASRLSMSVMKRGDVSRVCTASAAGGVNWLLWHASARRLVS